ncbi:MAG: hypothetical protein GMKNLPBB_02322 [Myxococcota bacterium]|nr:hypothetical protein [Myxococcota bacterium]
MGMMTKIIAVVALGAAGGGGMDKIKGAVAKASSIFAAETTKIELNEQLHQVRSYLADNNMQYPYNYADFLRKNFDAKGGRDPAVDQWGSPYQLEPNDEGFKVRSCGPDKQCNTDDDIMVANSSLARMRRQVINTN